MSSETVLDVNAAFYRAIRRADMHAMDALWASGRAVSCTHPSGPGIRGRAAVMESWRLILEDGVALPIVPAEAQAIVTGTTAMVLCHEIIGDMVLMASNAFVLEDGRWRLINHQSAPIPGTVR
jgi:hypothetical protein